MEFSEKLSKLLAISESQSAQLAKYILLDPSQISRMKTGARGRPGSRETLRLMAEFFAKKCTGEYLLSALAELTGDMRITSNRSEQTSAEIIYAWLMDNDEYRPTAKASKPTVSLDGISKETHEGKTAQSLYFPSYDNTGKRRAMLELFDTVLAGDTPGDIYLFSDEDPDWLYEDERFDKELAVRIARMAEWGCRFYRVEPPAQDIDGTLRAIERWLPAYCSGAMRIFNYPRLRDELHRRTLFVAPGRAAMFSRSLAGQKSSRLTVFCKDEGMISLCLEEVLDIMRLCRPMMRMFTVGNAQEINRCLEDMAGAQARGTYKSASLSTPLLPYKVMERVYRDNGSEFGRMLLENRIKRAALREDTLKKHIIEDIIVLSDLDRVRAGEIPVPGTGLLPGGMAYYRPEEYRLHLERILEMMEKFENYRVILTDDPRWNDMELYAKEDDRVVIVKEREPGAVFEITDSRISAGFCHYLRGIVEYERSRTDRRTTMARLREAIYRLD